jgi:two-component system, NtrC family, nitrogen regulation sensor histidine kinase GlnL
MLFKKRVSSHIESESKRERLRLTIVLPFLMALFSGGSAVFVLTFNTEYKFFFTNDIEIAGELLLCMGLAAAAGIALARGITQPLQELSIKMEKMAAGNFMQPLDMAAEQEIESLAKAFNSMMSSLNRYILEGMAGAVITVDGDKRVMSFNPVAEIVFGYPQEVVVGKPLIQVIPDQGDNRPFFELLNEAIRQGRGCAGQDVSVITHQGERIRMRVSLSLLKGDAGTRVGILATFKNLAEIQRLRDQLQRADQLMTLGTMTAGIAHEIRNPLGSISGLLQLLREDLEGDEHKLTYIDTIMKATDRINNLIEDLLTLANPSLTRSEIRQINALLQETIGFARFDNLAKKVEIQEQYDPEVAPVQVDSEKLGQAFLNIVRNAIQATPVGGTITIRTMSFLKKPASETAQGEEGVRILFANTGSYIPPENYKQIFTPFFSTKKEGSGLGLSITKQIILAHGGSIEVESSEGEGTTFCVELPAAARESREAA